MQCLLFICLIFFRSERGNAKNNSRVEAAVYGSGRNTWRLQGDFTLRKEDGVWKLTSSRASTY